MADVEIKEESIEKSTTQEEVTKSAEELETQNNKNDENTENEEQATKQKQVPILKKILFALVGFLLLTLIIGSVLFFIGFFDPEEKIKVNEKEDVKVEKIVEESNNFNIKDINSKKLNKQLLLLTNKNIVEEEENDRREKEEQERKIKEQEDKKKEEALALEEENLSKEKELLEDKKLELQKEKEELEILKNEAIALRNEMINNQKIIEENKIEESTVEIEINKQIQAIEQVKKEVKKVTVEEEIKFVSLINVAKIKGELLKSYLDKITVIYSDIKLCRDDLNRIEIYYGPFTNNMKRSNIHKKLQENKIINSYEVELTTEEFNKRCNY